MRVVESPDQITKERWRKFLEGSLFSSPFQSWQYFQCINETPNSGAKVFALFEKDELEILMVVTLMQERGFQRVFSKRGIVFGGPVLGENLKAEQLAFFLKHVSKKLRGESIYVETRNFFDYSSFIKDFNNAGWKYEPYLNYQLSLMNVKREDVLSLLSYNRRREIRGSLSLGATYNLCSSESEVHDVYEILRRLYSERVKVPLPSLDFFLSLFHNNILKVFIVKHDGKCIGGSFCPFQEGKNIFTFYYCGLRDYQKSIFPTHLAVLAAIEYAIDKNIPIIDFMGAGKPDVSYGVRQYKSEFGGTLVEFGRFLKILNPTMFRLGKVGLNVKKLIC